MIIDQKKTTLAYRCPHCGAVPTSMVGAFSLSGDLFKLKCSCGNSHLTVEKTNDDKLRLTVPCVVCPQPHTYGFFVGGGEFAFLLTAGTIHSGIKILRHYFTSRL